MDVLSGRPVTNIQQVFEMLTLGEITTSEAFEILARLEGKDAEKYHGSNDEEDLQKIMMELDGLIGLTEVKQLVKEIQAYAEIQRRRREENLQVEPQALHMIFKGNPGTGKTTVARLLGKMFKHMKVLQKGHTVEVERADLVGEYIGHTAQKTREQLKRALGGILFIDEAYSLARGGERDFGKEAIDTLVKAMEDHKDDLIVILAGYKEEMDRFLQINPGLRSRFPIVMEFNDYIIQELIQIAVLMAEKRDYKFTKEALEKLENELKKAQNHKHYDKMGNARMVRNILEKALRRQALRLVRQRNISREDLVYIRAEDIVEVEDP